MFSKELEFFKKYEIINPYMFSSTFNIRKKLKKIIQRIWFEFLYKSIKIEKILFFGVKNFTFLSNYLKKVNSFQIIKENVCLKKITEEVIIKLPEKFIIVCIDEYINGRKKGSRIFNNDKSWTNISWKKLEEIFEIIIIHLKFQKKQNLLIFLVMESFRYDILSDMFIKENSIQKKNKLTIDLTKNFFVDRHKSYFVELIKNLCKKNYNTLNNQLKKCLENFSKTKYINIFFYQKKKGIVCILLKFLKYMAKKISFLCYGFFGSLSTSGLINNDIFWSKKFSRDFLFILTSIIFGLLYKEMTFITNRENNKLFTRINSKIFLKVKDLQKWCETCNLTKIAFVFLINVLTTNSKNSYSLIDFLYSLEYKKINSWLKFLTGFCFSISQGWNLKFFQTFLNLIEKNWLSDYLKGGILFGMGISIKNLIEFRELFIEKYFNILKTGFLLDENKGQMTRNGAYLAIALSTGISIKNELKENFFKTLISNIAMSLKTGELSALSFGLYIQNDSSKYVLKNLLKITNIVRNEKTTRFLFFSIALIYKNNKEVATHLFEKLFIHQNPIIRSGVISIYTIAFTGSCNLKITERILESISNDLDDNVKKTSIISLGFLFFSKFSLLEKIVIQFIDHFNPFIRYGVCFAIGISSFGKNSYKAIEFLEKLSNDKIDFVRQGSFIALGLSILNDKNNERKKKVKSFFEKKLFDENHTEMSRFGIIIGYALTELHTNEIILNNKRNLIEKKEITGLFLFIQYWYWLPCILFIFLIC
nr:26S proteasome regulatory subunit [Cryptomonas curvata]